MSKVAMCDRCGKIYSAVSEDKPDPKYTLYRWYAHPNDQKGAKTCCHCMDLCDECLAELEIFMEKGKAKDEAEHGTTEPEKTDTSSLIDLFKELNRVWRQ